MAKAMFILGLAVGYVLGARAGRDRYDQLKERATGAWQSPRVQRNVDTAKGAADAATQKVRERMPGSSSHTAPASTGSPESAWSHEEP